MVVASIKIMSRNLSGRAEEKHVKSVSVQWVIKLSCENGTFLDFSQCSAQSSVKFDVIDIKIH